MKAVDFLSGELLANPDKAWSVGPLGHALHSLMIYHERLYNEPALPAVSQTAAVPLKTKAASISAISPPEPECDNSLNLDISQLARVADAPKVAGTASAHATESSTAKEIADRSDGCTDAIPARPALESELKLALRDIIAAIVPQPDVPPAAASGPKFPADAPFDRPSAAHEGP